MMFIVHFFFDCLFVTKFSTPVFFNLGYIMFLLGKDGGLLMKTSDKKIFGVHLEAQESL